MNFMVPKFSDRIYEISNILRLNTIPEITISVQFELFKSSIKIGGPKSKFEHFYHVTANLSGILKVKFRIGVNNIDSIYFTKRQKCNYSKYSCNS